MEKNLGHATAYGYAKSKGYSGTEDEFAQLMADYASVGQSAAQSAEQAAASATSASGSAATATQAAQTATSKASDAIIAEGVATAKAEDAQAYATSANQSAESASTSAQTATAKAGTATAKADEAAASEAAALSAKTDAESARDAAAQSASEAAASAESIDPDEFDRKIYAAFATDTASGSIAHFEDGADGIPMKDVVVHIEPMQEGSGDPSPDNIRPITGWTGAKVMRAGKNLLNPTLASGTYTGNGITWTLNNDGSVTASGAATATSYLWLYGSSSAPIPSWIHKLAGKTVTASTGNGHFTRAGYASIQVIFYGSPTLVIREETATIPSDLSPYTGFAIVLFANTGNTVDATVYPQLELGSTATDYEPYSGQTYDITFPAEAGTVYGGTLDVTSGVLTVDRAMVDLGTPNWTKHASLANTFQAFRPDTSPAWAVIPNGGVADAICDIYKLTTSASGGVGAIDMSIALGTGTSITMYVHDSRFTDVSDFKSSVSGSKIVYHLASPITYTLTPQEITSLLGTNNLWADTGDSEVEYRADTKMYIDNKIAELQALVLENNGGN